MRYQLPGSDRFARTKARSQRSQSPAHIVVKQGLEAGQIPIHLLLILNILGSQLLVERHVARAGGGGDLESLQHLLARYLAKEPDTELDEREALTLRSGERRKVNDGVHIRGVVKMECEQSLAPMKSN